jgi:hypothetical protein
MSCLSISPLAMALIVLPMIEGGHFDPLRGIDWFRNHLA